MMRIQTPYTPDYATCAYTHAWLRIMSETLDPDAVSELPGMPAMETPESGGPWGSKPDHRYKKSGWWICTSGVLKSLDAREHLDWILAKLDGCDAAFEKLHAEGHLIDLCVRWDSKSGHGGPTISPVQMKRLAELGIELWFDVYFDDGDGEKG